MQGKKSKQKSLGGWTWTTHSSVYIGSSASIKPSQKIGSYDMDDTIITRKSGAKWPKNADDWMFLNNKVVEMMQKRDKEGYKIVIFTNQAGVLKGHTNINDIKKKIENIAKELKVEMQAFIATAQDQFRKPGTAMWTLLEKNNNGHKIEKSKSFYCGDAAGRKKDFSDSDLKFALNVEIEFLTPENEFLGSLAKVEVKGFNPSTIPSEGEIILGKGDKHKINFVEKQMVIFCGSPASGKSTFWQNYLPQYSRINRDTLKTKQKCYKVAEQQILAGKSVVIDNTNPKKIDRAYFINLAKNYEYKIRCFQFLTPKDICFHNDYQRVANDKRKHLSGKAGSIPIHSFFKYKEEPQLSEGFYEINKVNFVTKFEDNEDKDFYKKFSKK